MVRVSDKVMIPQDEHPDINFVGLLIGPRGNTLKCKFFASPHCILSSDNCLFSVCTASNLSLVICSM